jgi:hypothetical protein
MAYRRFCATIPAMRKKTELADRVMIAASDAGVPVEIGRL